MDEEPVRVASRTQYLVIRVDHEVDAETSANVHEPTSPFTWDWNALDYSPVTDKTPRGVWVYGIFDGDFLGVPDRENPSIYWHRPYGHEFPSAFDSV